MFSHPERRLPLFGHPSAAVLEEGLLVPFYVKGEAVGTMWIVSHDTTRHFDAEDLRVMTNLGIFAAAAYQTLLSLNALQRFAVIVEGATTRSSARTSTALSRVGTTARSASSAIRPRKW